MTHLFAIVGWHNAGKTTVVEGLVQEFRRSGARVAVVKHSREGFDLDHPGTDTWRFAQAGSDAVVIASKSALAWFENTVQEVTLQDIVARLDPSIDVVIAEGFKREACPKIEVMRAATGTDPIVSAQELLAIVTDDVMDPRPAPKFGFDHICELADYLAEQGLGPRPRP